MNTISRQAIAGACLAAALMLGANAGAGSSAPSAPRTAFVGSETLAGVWQTGRDAALDVMFDVAGEVVARIKQL